MYYACVLCTEQLYAESTIWLYVLRIFLGFFPFFEIIESLNNKFYNRQTALMVKKNHYRKKYILLFQMDKVLCHKLVIESEIHYFDN